MAEGLLRVRRVLVEGMEGVDMVRREGVMVVRLDTGSRIGMGVVGRMLHRGGREGMVVCLAVSLWMGKRTKYDTGLGRTNSNDTMSTEAGRNELYAPLCQFQLGLC
jgi:hypothetical protein